MLIISFASRQFLKPTLMELKRISTSDKDASFYLVWYTKACTHISRMCIRLLCRRYERRYSELDPRFSAAWRVSYPHFTPETSPEGESSTENERLRTVWQFCFSPCDSAFKGQWAAEIYSFPQLAEDLAKSSLHSNVSWKISDTSVQRLVRFSWKFFPRLINTFCFNCLPGSRCLVPTKLYCDVRES